MIRIAILASGNGTNAQALIDYFRGREDRSIVMIASDNPAAYVLERAKQADIPAHIMPRSLYTNGPMLLDSMHSAGADVIVLAGYLKLLPKELTQDFADRIINIHPSLLPKYGGKGMYGERVHQAVIDNKEAKSGVTIHYVNEHYDEGRIIVQEELEVQPDWDADTLQQHIHQLEHKLLPVTVDNICRELSEKTG